MNKIISVIIPAYNSETTITKCVNSIQQQSYKDLEIIVINDGSQDNTEAIVRSLQEQDNRIKLISVPNGGVSYARNIGIDNATGDYITFVDSDDYIDSGMYECLIAIIKKYNVKIAHCSYRNIDESGNVISVVGNKGVITEQNHDDAISCILSGKLFAGGLCNKMYEFSLFRDVRLNEKLKYNEDVLANFLLFDKVDRSVYIDKTFYNYVSCESSSTHTSNYLMSCNQSLFVCLEMQKLSQGKSYERASQYKVALCYLELYRAHIFIKSKRSIKKDVMSKILEYKSEGFYNNKREKILIILYRYFPNFFRFSFRFYDKIRVKKLDPEQ